MEAEILHQLVWIKWLPVSILGAFVAAVIYLGFAMAYVARLTERVHSEVPFPERAKSLLDEGKPEGVIALAESRIAKFPADPQAHWFLAQACYRTGDLKRTLIALRKTQELQPDWESAYTGPLLRVVEQRIADGKHKVDLKVVTLTASPKPDEPPAGEEPAR